MPHAWTFLKRHSLLIGLLATLGPLAALLALQFVWLQRLERMSAMVYKASLASCLETIGTKVQYFYRAKAERLLNIPPSYFLEGRLEYVARKWSGKDLAGVSRLFLIDYTRDASGKILVYDEKTEQLAGTFASEESMAMIIAAMPWQVARLRGGDGPVSGLSVDDSSETNRIIINPIVESGSRVVGLAGMIVDDGYFRRVLLKEITDVVLPSFFPRALEDGIAVNVRDRRGRPVFVSAKDDGRAEAVAARMPFIFTDWTLSLRGPVQSPEYLAKSSFRSNITIALVLGLQMALAIVLTLRSARRSIKLSEMKSDFVSNVSHELRTPVASIRVFAELLRLGRVTTPERVREYGEAIETESRRLTSLINNILDFARIESGRREYDFEPADVRSVVRNALEAFRVRTRAAGFRLDYREPEGELPPARIDADALGQAVHNLLDNAIKYSGDRRVIEVDVGADEAEVRIAIGDHGIGIAKDEQLKIFDRFHRVGTGAIHDVKGTGLGLSIVQHIVHAHRGRVTVESQLGRGSTFTIHLPVSTG